ncbi:MAG: substrate-binding domain-containing protein [Oscillibacter sp.]|nr:substrate-binding domain-containing protein [Oscillibacter sp.]
MKKRLVSLLLFAAVLTLSACGAPPAASSASSSAVSVPAPQEGQFVFTRENFPRMDGSTSTVPLGQAIASVLLGESREDVADLIQFSKTTQSYRQLMSGGVDLLIAAEPAEIIWQEKEEQKFQWQMEPFAIDALVFVVNADNPVDSLSTEQIQKIYTGEITNWSEVGGEDLDIVPFQRNEEAGSQTAMKKLVMGDLPMMDAPADYVRGEMGDLIKAVSAYDDSASAIGYTVYYYANDMKMADGLKILAVDGVDPNTDTIRSGSYPFLNNYYVVCSTQPAESTQVLYDWILFDEGQKLVAQEGYVSVSAVEETAQK